MSGKTNYTADSLCGPYGS